MPRPHTIEIIAHRGASRDRLENTLSAFRAAVDQGADGIELDVHATRDGVVVVHHDPVVKRRSVSSGSRGSLSLASGKQDLVARGLASGSLSLASGKQDLVARGSLSLGREIGENASAEKARSEGAEPKSRASDSDPLAPNPNGPGASDNDPLAPTIAPNPNGPGASDNDPLAPPLAPNPNGGGASDNDPLENLLEIARLTYAELSTLTLTNGEQIPTLAEVLSLTAGKATVYVEVKGAAIEQLVVDCLARHPNTMTAVHSFDHRIPYAVGQLDRSVPLGILSSSYVLDLAHMINTAGARDLWQHTALVDQALVDAAHAAGARVVVWTENNFEHAIQLVQMGVDAICTDIPGPMRNALSDAGLIRPYSGAS